MRDTRFRIPWAAWFGDHTLELDLPDIWEVRACNLRDAPALDRERRVLAEQARASGKPEQFIEKMVEGRLRKHYEEIVLLEQVYVIDGKSKMSEVVEGAAGDVGAPVRVTGFVRFALGEGGAQGNPDAATEVAEQLAG